VIVRTARWIATAPPLRALKRVVTERLRRLALLSADLLPDDILRFDRRSWVIKETEAGTRVWCSLDERAISRPILVDAYERSETKFIARIVQPGDSVVDAGANIGFHTVHMAKLAGPGGHVDAFEPLDYLADALDASIEENEFGAIVRVHRLALDERDGLRSLRHAPRTVNFGGGHLAPDGPVPPDHADVLVPTARLDDVLAGRRCRFIKLDVEGAEPRVVRGAIATLANEKPVILAELHERQLQLVSGIGATAFIAQMAALGYACKRLNRDGTRGSRLDRYDETAPLNVVFDPQPPQ
jgi:FkbM family methyltransferase